MTTSAADGRTSALTDNEWWNRAIGQTFRAIWHFVGFYVALEAPVERLTAALFVGVPPSAGAVPLPLAATLLLATLLAVLLSAVRPEISSARTLAFGFAATLGFRLAQYFFGQPQLAGRPLVALDAALAAVGTLSLSAVVVYGFDWADLTSEEAEP